MTTTSVQQVNKKCTLLGYELTTKQTVFVNCLIPSLASCLLYILLISTDIAVVFRHYKDSNPIWGSLTICFMYLPALSCYIYVISCWDLWPEQESCSENNINWFLSKTVQHLLFPVWSMWRYAERIFWSLEAFLNDESEDEQQKSMSVVSAPRTIELYSFLQSYLHSVPQVLLQLYVLMRHQSDMDKQTADALTMSIIYNITKTSITTAYYQRFKTQKLAGKQYPWYKPYRNYNGPSFDEVNLRHNPSSLPSNCSVIETRPITSTLEENYNLEPSTIQQQRRRSSDIYLEPTSSLRDSQIVSLRSERETSSSWTKNEPNFNIKRVVYTKGLPDDDMAGRMVSFCWWFCFLLARFLAITAFGYFYQTATIWLIFAHFVLIILVLLYDVKTDELNRGKIIFFLFIAFVYLFVIIEFKIKFKKTKILYYGFFGLVFGENFVMCLIWWFRNVDDLQNEFWFRYIFYFVVMCTIISFSSMIFYLNVNKPKKIVVSSRLV